jgi:hypothetical protein
VYGVEWEPNEKIGGARKTPAPATLGICFHEEVRVTKWPRLFSGDVGNCTIFFFTREIADEMVVAGFTGIEFHPIEMELGNLKGLRGKESERPEYLWGRVFGTLLVELSFYKRPAKVDSTGLRLLEDSDGIPMSQRDIKIRPNQPYRYDFCYCVPDGAGNGWVAISKRVAEYFDSLKLKEASIGATGGGFL